MKQNTTSFCALSPSGFTRGLVLLLACCWIGSAQGDTPRVLPTIWEEAPAFIYPQGLDRVEFEIPMGRRWEAEALEEAWALAVDVRDDDPLHWEQLAVQFFALNRFNRVLHITGLVDERHLTRTHTLNWIEALSLEAIEDWPGAFQAWKRIHQAQSGDTLPLIRMVISLLHQDEVDAAYHLLRQSSHRFPRHSTLAHLLAAVYWQNAQPQAAWRALARAAAAPEAPTDTLLFMAWLCILNDDPDPATGWLRRALATQPSERRLPLLAHPAFAALHERPAFQALLDEQEWALADIQEGPGASLPATDNEPGDLEPADRVTHHIVDRYQVSVRLQDHEEPNSDHDVLLGLPGDRPRFGLRLGTTESGTEEQHIHWHEMPE